MHLDIVVGYGVGAIDGVISEMFSRVLPYFKYWKKDQHGLLRASYLMRLIQF